MKKIVFAFVMVCLSVCVQAEKTNRWFLGGTAAIGYTDYFAFSLEPQAGYEFTDRWAAGLGLGMSMAAVDGSSVVVGVVEPFARFTAWHNDLIYIDVKGDVSVGFDSEFVMLQLGLVPSLRFRVNDHWDVAADFGLFGAQDVYGDWSPVIGINAANLGISAYYRF